MNNSGEHLKFIKKEKNTRIVLWLYLIFFTTLTGLSWDWSKYLFNSDSHKLYFALLTNVIIFVLLLIYVLYKLISIMAKFHVEEYEIHRSRIVSFVLIELLIILYQFNHDVRSSDLDKYSPFSRIIWFIQLSGLPVVLQTFGLVYMKSSKDPM